MDHVKQIFARGMPRGHRAIRARSGFIVVMSTIVIGSEKINWPMLERINADGE